MFIFAKKTFLSQVTNNIVLKNANYLFNYTNYLLYTFPIMNKRKIFNDPVYGFISIPYDIVFDVIEHPYFQRLRRIQQLGLSSLVYPGATHSRFHHSLGAMHLMSRSLEVLKSKGHDITEAESEAAVLAILLHDLGHGPFSHALEGTLVENIHHEHISLLLMKTLQKKYGKPIETAIQIFTGKYPKKFLHQLISGQLDMDRMDYLNRDSFYSGVSEGVIGYDRLINMLDVHDDNIVVEEKGIYSVEKFLVARRLMYWQAYLHKTSVVAELILTKILKRAKELTQKGLVLPCSESLQFFMQHKISLEDFDKNVLDKFSYLDDYDVMGAIKSWQFNDDYVLKNLCRMILNRDLLKIQITEDKPNKENMLGLKNKFISKVSISEKEADYFVFKGKLKNQAYSKSSEPIYVLKKDKTIEDVVEASDQMYLKALSKEVTKYYICFPKVVLES